MTNNNPVARPDSFTFKKDSPENYPPFGLQGVVLDDNWNGNDYDVDNNPLSVRAKSGTTANGGTFTIDSNGFFTYTNYSSFSGMDVISYTLLDGQGGSSVGVLRVAVTDDNSNTIGGSTANDFIYAWGGHDVIQAGNGSDLVVGGAGNDTIFGGSGDDSLWGDQHVFDFYLTEGHDTIFAGAGNDIVEGGEGNDNLYGDSGDDHIGFGDGTDFVNGGEGNDVIGASVIFFPWGLGAEVSGSKTIDAGNGNDSITVNTLDGSYVVAGQGNDFVFAGDGNDLIYGNEGDDSIDAGNGTNTVFGGSGNDQLAGGTGDDILDGGSDNDIIHDGAGGNDIMLGQEGDDTFYAIAGNDLVYAGTGLDTLNIVSSLGDYRQVWSEDIKFFRAMDPMAVPGAPPTDLLIQTPEGRTIRVSEHFMRFPLFPNNGLEELQLTDKTMILKDVAPHAAIDNFNMRTGHLKVGNILTDNGFGEDLDFDDGAVTVTAKSGTTSLGGVFSVGLDGAFTYQATAGFVGMDTVTYRITDASGDISTGVVRIFGSNDNANTLNGSSSKDYIEGLGGNDTIRGNAGGDFIWGGEGTDRLYGGEGRDKLYGGNGNDRLNGGADDDNLFGDAGNDTIFGGFGNDYIYGGQGADSLFGEAGADTFVFSADDNFPLGADVVRDFSTLEDRLDFSSLFEGYDVTQSNITQFLSMTSTGPNTLVQVDRDGVSAGHGFVRVATIMNVTGLDDEASLLSSDKIIV